MKTLLAVLFCLAAAAFVQRPCAAQVQFSQIPRYQPARSTTSPYLNLLRRDSGPAPNYFSLVRPAISQNAAIERQQFELRRQQTLIQGLQDVELEEIGTQQRSTQIRATGAAATFRNYLHYYPLNRARIPTP